MSLRLETFQSLNHLLAFVGELHVIEAAFVVRAVLALARNLALRTLLEASPAVGRDH